MTRSLINWVTVIELFWIRDLSVEKCAVPFGGKFSPVFPTNGKRSSRSILFAENCTVPWGRQFSPLFPYKWKALQGGFQLSVESNLHLLLFCIATLCDWFKNSRPSQPTISATKTNYGLLARVTRAWRRLHVIVWSSDWFVLLFVSVVIGHGSE